MNLDEVCRELLGWRAYFKGDRSPDVEVRIGNARSQLTCMEIGSKTGVFQSELLKITIGEWRHPGEEDDHPVDDTGTVIVDPSMS